MFLDWIDETKINWDFIENKFTCLKNILNNPYLNNDNKNVFLSIFSKSQRVYYSFVKLAYLYRLRKAPLQINTDLSLNEINSKQKNVITILQNGSKYLFTISDLLKIINTGLSNTSYFFTDPYIPKNPYNNIQFNNTILYNIFFFAKYNFCTTDKIFHLFQLFYITDFNLKMFEYENEAIIRDISIKNYVFNTPYTILYNDVKTMMFNTYWFKRLSVDSDFPRNVLVDIMRPYLHLYYLYKYSVFGTTKSKESTKILEYKSYFFFNYNPGFGRKVIKINKIGVFSKKTKITESFNTDHLKFYSSFSSKNSFHCNRYNYLNTYVSNVFYYNNSNEVLDNDSDDESE
jgi:hypothetical protein